MRTFPPPRRGRKLSSLIIEIFIPVCQDIAMEIARDHGHVARRNKNSLRWLLRRGSPLPIPNREVKPACADGTAILWESMSPPFFENPFSNEGIFFATN